MKIYVFNKSARVPPANNFFFEPLKIFFVNLVLGFLLSPIRTLLEKNCGVQSQNKKFFFENLAKKNNSNFGSGRHNFSQA